MSKNLYGSPHLKDATALWEEDIEAVATETAQLIQEDSLRIMNRPPGTVPVKPEDQAFDFRMGINDPNFWRQKAQPFLDQGDSLDLMRWKVLRYYHEMAGRKQ